MGEYLGGFHLGTVANNSVKINFVPRGWYNSLEKGGDRMEGQGIFNTLPGQSVFKTIVHIAFRPAVKGPALFTVLWPILGVFIFLVFFSWINDK